MTCRIYDTCSYGQANGIINNGPELHIAYEYFIKETCRRQRTKLNLTRLNTVRDRSARVSRLRKLEETRMNDALDRATSLPDPMAIPTSAAVKAYEEISELGGRDESVYTHRSVVDSISYHAHDASFSVQPLSLKDTLPPRCRPLLPVLLQPIDFLGLKSIISV